MKILAIKIKLLLTSIFYNGFRLGISRYFFRSFVEISTFEWKLFKYLVRHTSFVKKSIEKIISLYSPKQLLTKVYTESTNDCNADCVMCERKRMTRRVGIMDYDLFKKIAAQSAALGIQQMRFHNFGEALMDPLLDQKIQYAKSIGIPSTAMYTNGSLLHAEHQEKLISSHLDHLFISMDGATPKTYEKIRRNLNYEQVNQNIREFISLRNSKGSQRPLVELSMLPMASNANEIEAFKQNWQSIVDGVNISKLHDFAGQSKKNKSINKNEKKIPCYMLWRSLFILWNGDVTICCMDFDGKIIVGNVNDTDLLDIWTSKRFNRLRLLHLKNKLSLCKNCYANTVTTVDEKMNALKLWI